MKNFPLGFLGDRTAVRTLGLLVLCAPTATGQLLTDKYDDLSQTAHLVLDTLSAGCNAGVGTCADIWLYSDVAGEPFAVSLSPTVGSASCVSAGPNDWARDAVLLQGQQDELLEAIFISVWELGGGPSDLFVVPFLSIPECCISTYQSGVNPGTLASSGEASPGSTVQFNLLKTQSAEAQSSLVISTMPSAQDVPGYGQLLVDLLAPFLVVPMGTSGDGTFELALPSDPLLVGTRFYCQAFSVDGTALPLVQLTNGVMVPIG